MGHPASYPRYMLLLPWRRLILGSCLFLLLEPSGVWGKTEKEQTSFDADSSLQITRPVLLPDSVLQILAQDSEVVACGKENPIPPGASLASWFAASEIRLDGPEEVDLVVLPVAQGNRFLCFHSVEGIGWFWVFHQVGAHYELVLKTAGLGLIIRDARHHGYRDIQSGMAFGTHSSQTTYRFENGKYLEYRSEAQ
jgi:hypothetical protein